MQYPAKLKYIAVDFAVVSSWKGFGLSLKIAPQPERGALNPIRLYDQSISSSVW